MRDKHSNSSRGSRAAGIATAFATAVLTAAALLAVGSRRVAADDVELVGDYGRPQSWVFEGATLFTAAAICDELDTDLKVRCAAHPQAPLAEFLQVVQQAIAGGYLRSGCPDAKIDVQCDTAKRRIIVRCDEGRQYRVGEVRVSPADSPVAQSLIAGLQEPIHSSDAWQKGFRLQNGKLVGIWTAGSGEESLLPAWWVPGKPAPFDAQGLAKVEERLKSLLEDCGYYSAKCRLNVVPDPDRAQADLVIDLEDLGTQATIGEIEISGNERNSREGILAFLDLRIGQPTSFVHRSRMAYQLWHSARFARFKIPPPPAPGADGKVKLSIDVSESEDVPLLNEPFSPEIAAVLKARDWVYDWNADSQDICVQMEGESRLKIVVSRQRALLAEIWISADGNPDRPADFALVLSPPSCALYSFRSQRKIVFNAPGTLHINSFIKNGRLQSAFGMRTAMRNRPAFACDVDLPPAAVASAAHDLKEQGDLDFQWRDQTLLLTWDDEWLQIDADRGEVVGIGSKSDDVLHYARLERGTYDRRIQQIEQQSAAWSNAYDPDRAATSIVRFLCGELHTLPDTWLNGGFGGDGLDRLAVIDKLLAGGLLKSVDVWLARKTTPSEFTIPWADTSPRPGGDWRGQIIDLICWKVDDLFPRNSWGWTLGNEWRLNAHDNGAYVASTLDRLSARDDSGPLCCLLMAWLAADAKLDPVPFAKRGLARLNVDDFRNDYRALLRPATFFGDSAIDIAAALRTLDEYEMSTLEEWLMTGNLEELIVRVVRALAKEEPTKPLTVELIAELRARGDEPVEVAIERTLDTLWTSVLRAFVESELREAIPRE